MRVRVRASARVRARTINIENKYEIDKSRERGVTKSTKINF